MSERLSGSEARALLRALETKVDALEEGYEHLKSEVAEMRLEQMQSQPLIDLQAGPREWRQGVDPDLLPEEPAHEHHNESIALLPVRWAGDDRRREIVRLYGWMDGTRNGEPHSHGYRLEHRRRLPRGEVWTSNQTGFLVENSGLVYGKDGSANFFDPWPVNVTHLVETSDPIGIEPMLPTGPWPEIDATGVENGTHMAWPQVFQATHAGATTGQSRYMTVIAWDQRPYLAAWGAGPPEPSAWWEIRDGAARNANGVAIEQLRFQRLLDPTEVFPA